MRFLVKGYRKIQVSDLELGRLQDQIASVVNPLSRIEILDGVAIKDIAITTAAVNVEHGLNRQPLGWILIDNTADARVWRTDWNSNYISLDASGTSTISIWVF